MADSDKLTALQQLSAQIPVANSRIAQGQAAARNLQLQNTVKQAPQGSGVAQAQQVGAEQAANTGQQTLATQEQGQKDQAQLAQVGAQQQSNDVQNTLTGLQQGTQKQQQDQVAQFAAISAKAKQESFDSRLQFQKDEAGRTFLNQRQMADYAKLQSATQDQMKTYAQQATEANQAQIQVLTTMNNKLRDSLQNQATRDAEGLSKMSDQDIYKMQVDVQQRLAKAKADAANTGAIWGAGGTIVGAVVGGVFGGSAGAQVGGMAGGAGGTAVGQGQAQPGLNSGYSGATGSAQS